MRCISSEYYEGIASCNWNGGRKSETVIADDQVTDTVIVDIACGTHGMG
jgi:hypothetical protein